MNKMTRDLLSFLAMATCLAGLGLHVPGVVSAAPADKAKKREATLEEKQFFADAKKALDEQLAKTNEACGTKITARYDVDSFVHHDAGTTYIRPPCEGALNAVRETCRADVGKEAVKAKISVLECRYTAEDTRAELAKQTLVAHINPKKTSIKGKQPGSYSWLSAVKELL